MKRLVVPAAVVALCAPIVGYYEGYIPHTYADPIGIPTACYGHTGPDVTPGRRYTRAECNALLSGDLAIAYGHVKRCIHVPLKDYEAAAYTSAAFNAGPRVVCGSTLQRLANAGRMREACRQLYRWVYAGGIKLRGLERRRAAEVAMCEGRA